MAERKSFAQELFVCFVASEKRNCELEGRKKCTFRSNPARSHLLFSPFLLLATGDRVIFAGEQGNRQQVLF